MPLVVVIAHSTKDTFGCNTPYNPIGLNANANTFAVAIGTTCHAAVTVAKANQATPEVPLLTILGRRAFDFGIAAAPAPNHTNVHAIAIGICICIRICIGIGIGIGIGIAL